ncbi:MAG TPA: hypothetical protein VMY37_11420 [Thermoguttaceae bacterium]|nr:hypothetical protein [Thermoguttaceae bacterium]
MSRNERSPRVIWAICLTTVLCGVLKVEPLQAGETLAEQRARIERMDPARKAELRRAQEQFAALGSAERQRLHDLHDQIEAHPRSDELLAVMERYCEWVNTLAPSERADLRELPPDGRIEKIKELREEQSRRRQSGPGGGRGFAWGERLRKLSLEEQEALTRWLDEHMERNAPELIEALPEEQQKKLREELEQAKDDPQGRRNLFVEMLVLWQLANPGKRMPLSDEALQALQSRLSPDARRSLEETSPDMQRRFLHGLIGAFVFNQSHEQLSEYLEKEITGRDREYLTGLPPEQMRQQLWWRYFRSKWPGISPPEHRPGRGWPRRPFSPGPDGPPGPRRRYDRDGPSPPLGPGKRPENVPEGRKPGPD